MSIYCTTSLDVHLMLSRSFSAAGHTLLVYDYLLTFREEVSLLGDVHNINVRNTYPWFQFVYIWNAPWTYVKILFLLSRYGNLVGQTAIRLEEAGILAHNSQEVCCYFLCRHDIYRVTDFVPVLSTLRNLYHLLYVCIHRVDPQYVHLLDNYCTS